MVNALKPDLRARGTGAQIFIQHILGDVISPPIIGAVSDATGSLLLAHNILPAFILLSSLFWAWAGLTLPELPALLKRQRSAPRPADEEGGQQGQEEWEYVHDDEHVSFWKVLCARESKGSKPDAASGAAAGGGVDDDEAAALGLGGRQQRESTVRLMAEEGDVALGVVGGSSR